MYGSKCPQKLHSDNSVMQNKKLPFIFLAIVLGNLIFI